MLEHILQYILRHMNLNIQNMLEYMVQYTLEHTPYSYALYLLSIKGERQQMGSGLETPNFRFSFVKTHYTEIIMNKLISLSVKVNFR